VNDEWLVGRRYLALDSLAPLLEERREQQDEEGGPLAGLRSRSTRYE
jgi:hypothetical protein